MIPPGRLRVSFRLLAGVLVAGSAWFMRAEMPPADEAGNAAAAAETPATSVTDDAGYALVGVVATAQGTLLSILRETDNLSLWIPVGGTRDDVTVVSYDARAERAVIRTAGQTLTLPLRDAGVAPGENEIAAAPSPAEGTGETVSPSEPPASPDGDHAAPTAVPEAEPPPPPDSEAEQATEARMLVSDLLDIGQQQREAYEAAQKAAGHATAPADPTAEPAPVAPEDAPAETPAPPSEDSTAAEPAR